MKYYDQNKESVIIKKSFFSSLDEWFDAVVFRLKHHSRPTATRYNLQLGRRLFHFLNGAVVATMYNLFLEHRQVVYILGMAASLLYLMEQIRIAYPEMASKFRWFSNFLLRAEEQLKESSAVPYAMALLLTIISFPKVVAIIAIYTLSIADPASAIIGIMYGKRKIAKNKSLEGSMAFFTATFLVALSVFLTSYPGYMWWPILKASFLIALLGSLVEIIPLRIDDNLTIPLSMSIITWIVCSLFSIPLI